MVIYLVAALAYLVASLALSAGVFAAPAQEGAVNPDAKLTLAFTEHVEDYVELRNKAEDAAPELERTKDPAEIRKAQLALAGRIKTARQGAKQGNIFTPALSAHFRRLLRPPVREKGTKEQIKEDNPGAIPFKINEPYPDQSPRSTVPPNVLESLPALPKNEDLEYRFVGRHLILLDTRANLILDYVPNAMP